MRQRREATQRRLFPDYEQRVRKGNRRKLILSTVILLTTARFTENMDILVPLMIVWLITFLPYTRVQK